MTNSQLDMVVEKLSQEKFVNDFAEIPDTLDYVFFAELLGVSVVDLHIICLVAILKSKLMHKAQNSIRRLWMWRLFYSVVQ